MRPRHIHLEGHYLVRAPREAVYRILTDFENLPRYFPKVAKSVRVLSREGDNFVVEAKTKAFPGARTLTVRMEGRLEPPCGFTSTNASSLGVEHERLKLEIVADGTRIDYANDVEIKSAFFQLFGGFLIKRFALWYWERAITGAMKTELER